MKWYNDQVKWYITPSEKVFTFFNKIYCGARQFNYDTLQEFMVQNTGASWQIFDYNVEPYNGNRIILSMDLTGVIIRPTSIAMADENDNLLCKIIISTDQTISTSITRVFNIELPYEEVGGVRIYPSFIPITQKKSTTPVGGESVMVDEHRHSAINLSTNQIDNFPNMTSAVRNFNTSVQSATFSIPGGSSYLFGEAGTLQSEHSDMTGQRTTGSTFLSGMRDRNVLDANILTRILEVIIMANNRIQILGKSIPVVDYVTTSGQGGTGSNIRNGEQTYFLVSDKTTSGNDRNLYAIKYNDFAKFLVGTPTSNEINTSVSVIERSTGATLTFNTYPALVIVKNTKPATGVTNTSWGENSIEVNKVSIPPQGTAVLFTADGKTVKGFHIAADAKCLVDSLANGTYNISKLTTSDGQILDLANGLFKYDNDSYLDLKINKLQYDSNSYLTATELSLDNTKIKNDGATIAGATNITSGGLTVSGGTEITSGGLIVSGNSKITGTLNVTGAVDFDSTLNVDEKITGNGLQIDGDSDLNGDLDVAGNTTLGDGESDKLTINGDVTISIGTLTLSELNIGTGGSYVTLTRNTSSGRLSVSTGVSAPSGFYVE